jgi:hypothetical protein
MRSIATEISWLTPFLFQKFEDSRAPSSDLASEISFEIGNANPDPRRHACRLRPLPRRACRALHESPKCGQPHHVLVPLLSIRNKSSLCHPMTKEVMADTIVDSRVRVRGIA